MDTRILYKFVEEVRRECRLAGIAGVELRSALAALDPERSAFFVRALLTHSTSVSRLLWPARDKSADRGKTLRTELTISDTSALRLARLRKALSETDASFEDWLLGLPKPDYIDFNLMPLGTMAGSREDTFQASLDPDTLEFSLRGDQANLAETIDEIKGLARSCDRWLRTHNPW